VRQPLEQAHLVSEPAQGLIVLDEVGADDLHDHEGEHPLLPRQIRLVAFAAAEQLDRHPAGSDLVPLRELPARPCRSPGGVRGRRGAFEAPLLVCDSGRDGHY